MADLNYRFTGVNKAQLENEVRLLREGERGYGRRQAARYL
jgi:hypothetical protein